MSILNSRLDKLEKHLDQKMEEIVTLIGDSKTDFEVLRLQHIKESGCDPEKTMFIFLIDSFGA